MKINRGKTVLPEETLRHYTESFVFGVSCTLNEEVYLRKKCGQVGHSIAPLKKVVLQP